LRQKLFKRTIFFLVLVSLYELSTGQDAPSEKQVTQYIQSWFSLNSTLRFSDHWGMVADIHVRRDDFIMDDYFYLLRAGIGYWISGKYPVILGVGHLWLAPPDGDSTWSNENRIYQQWSSVLKQGKVSVLNRIRLEQRFIDHIVNDEIVGNKQFSVRLRYLTSFEFKVFSNPKIPSPVLSDEIHIQFGSGIVYNTFDQNRLFLGVKVPVSEKLNFDIGYMNVLQQKSSGYKYSMSHIFRIFFYYNLDLTADE
jgi:hypothetical protein